MQQRRTDTTFRMATLVVATALTLSACGDDSADAALDDGVLTVEMSDFTYGDIPDEIPAGTRIEVANESENELHEFVTFRLAPDDDREIDAVIADAEALLTSGPPVAVLLAAPGGEQIAAVGDGTLAEPGRYVILCAIPTGADVDAYLTAAATSEGPPQVDGGPPHFANGMFAEITVTG